MISDGDSLVDRFNNYNDCENYLELHFSHLEPATNNIFSQNNLLCGSGLHLTVNALKQLIYLGLWVD